MTGRMVGAVMIEEQDIIENIQLLRLGNNWSQKDLAEAAGINYKTYNRIERNKHGLSVRQLQKLTKALGVSCEYIMSAKLGISREVDNA
jgi:transcriptional regulator with XRE-family HTH domain